VWITGGGSGIGLAIGKRFAQSGAHVTVFDLRLRDEAMLELDGARRLMAKPVRSYVLDVADGEQVRRLFNLAAKETGKPALVFNSAGIVSAVEFDRLSYDEWDRVIRVNLYGSRNVASAALPLLVPGARLALMASLAGIAGGYGYAAYAASKFGVIGLAEVLRVEWKPRGVEVSVICPPEVDTPMVQEERKFRPAATTDMKLFAGTLTVDEAADSIVSGLEKGRYLIVPGGKGKMTYLLTKYLPRIVSHRVADAIVTRALSKRQES
jgi:NAD(P)-dependent dehydrogenase (short-subunit alcohol dehydrogenase family)